MLKILVVAAVGQELAGMRPHQSPSVNFLVTGMGAVRAGQAVRRHLAQHPVDCVVSTGFAGGIAPNLKVGELLSISEVIEASSGERFRSSATVEGLRKAALISARKVCIWPGAKAAMGNQSGAAGVDLETASVARAAQDSGIPWIGLRAILDPMETPLWKSFFGIPRTSRSLAGGFEILVKQINDQGKLKKGESNGT
jgi:nucleoside phosphorylase